jgi:hypothetical protein
MVVEDRAAKMVVKDRAVKMVSVQAQTTPRRNRNLRGGRLFFVRSLRVARTEPTNDQEVEKALDAQTVKMVADQEIMKLRMIPCLPAKISRIYRKV